ncbi:MAG: carboxypeptidase-like regulatory domain-containing protein [Terriglobales bacterium]
MKRLWLLVFLLALGMIALAGDKDKYCDVKIRVLKDSNGKPIRNAAVVLHPVDSKGKQESGGLNLKTNQEGETGFSGVPYGKLRIQVIAHGMQTYGDDFEINQPEQEIVVKMKPPQKQYSIYEQPGAKPPGIDPDKKQK